MKKLIALCLLLLASSSEAANMQKIGFKAYSTNSSITCGVFGMQPSLSGGFQGFAPFSSHSRTLNLGTKGYANYTTVGKGAIKFTCRATGTNTLIPVKVQIRGFLNGIERHFLTLDSDTLIVQ